MSRLDEQLKQTLRRKEPSADFAARVMSRIQTDVPPATVHRLHARTRPTLPRFLAIAAMLALMLMAGMLWLILQRRQSTEQSRLMAVTNGAPEFKLREVVLPIKNPTTAIGVDKEPQDYQAAKRKPFSHQRTREIEPARKENFDIDKENLLAAENRNDSGPVLDDETARHLRKAQLLLRSFRNAGEGAGAATVDISYERQLSRELLNDNMLFRREAETRKNLPVKEVLSSLEPFLLDIANLSEKPSPDEMRRIKERMSKREIVAEMQVYSTRRASNAF